MDITLNAIEILKISDLFYVKIQEYQKNFRKYNIKNKNSLLIINLMKKKV